MDASEDLEKNMGLMMKGDADFSLRQLHLYHSLIASKNALELIPSHRRPQSAVTRFEFSDFNYSRL